MTVVLSEVAEADRTGDTLEAPAIAAAVVAEPDPDDADTLHPEDGVVLPPPLAADVSGDTAPDGTGSTGWAERHWAERNWAERGSAGRHDDRVGRKIEAAAAANDGADTAPSRPGDAEATDEGEAVRAERTPLRRYALAMLVIVVLAGLIVLLVTRGLAAEPHAPMTLRNRQLGYLIAVGALTGLGFATVYIARQAVVSWRSLTYAGLFIALYLAAHLVARRTVPNADPYLLPMAALLTAVGLTEIYRLNPDDAFRQALWVVIGVALFAARADLAAPRLPRARGLQVPLRRRRDRAAAPAAAPGPRHDRQRRDGCGCTWARSSSSRASWRRSR